MHQEVIGKRDNILLQFWRVEDFDMIGQADVESGDAFNLIDVCVEVPDVVIALVGLNEFLRRWELLNKKVLCEEV